MAKTLKMTKMASRDNPHPTVSGSDGSIHINLHKEVLTGFEEGIWASERPYTVPAELVRAVYIQ
jgi:hypothetical protein